MGQMLVLQIAKRALAFLDWCELAQRDAALLNLISTLQPATTPPSPDTRTPLLIHCRNGALDAATADPFR